MFDAIISTPIGHLGLQCDAAKLITLQFLDDQIIPLPFTSLPPKIKGLVSRIEAFFSFPQSLIDLPYVLQGTSFQRRVWQALCKIPLGKTCTYGELADKLNTSARAIGMACRTNPLPIVIPCHRVVSASGLGGYCGHTEGGKLAVKQWLLAHESLAC